tara:strand:- start:5044 stop:5454 length:411 start_codon:yes stop_codon:yes gene_type:complete
MEFDNCNNKPYYTLRLFNTDININHTSTEKLELLPVLEFKNELNSHETYITLTNYLANTDYCSYEFDTDCQFLVKIDNKTYVYDMKLTGYAENQDTFVFKKKGVEFIFILSNNTIKFNKGKFSMVKDTLSKELFNI